MERLIRNIEILARVAWTSGMTDAEFFEAIESMLKMRDAYSAQGECNCPICQMSQQLDQPIVKAELN